MTTPDVHELSRAEIEILRVQQDRIGLWRFGMLHADDAYLCWCMECPCDGRPARCSDSWRALHENTAESTLRPSFALEVTA